MKYRVPLSGGKDALIAVRERKEKRHMEENRMLDENMMTQATGGSGFEKPDE